MWKSESVVRSIGSFNVSVMRTRQASAKLIGTPAYFSDSLSTASRSSQNRKTQQTAPRRSREIRPCPPGLPSRWNASDRTASQVPHGGGRRAASATDQRWLPSVRLSSATRKPVSTRTLGAIMGRLQVTLGACAHVRRQPVDRTNKVGNGIERVGLLLIGSRLARQSFTHHVGLRQLAAARLGFDLRDQRLGQADGQGLHLINVLHHWLERNTLDLGQHSELSTRTNPQKAIG